MRKKEKPMEEQNRVNKEKDRTTQRQKTKVVAGREKVGEGAIRRREHKETVPPNRNEWRKKILKKRGVKKKK